MAVHRILCLVVVCGLCSGWMAVPAWAQSEEEITAARLKGMEFLKAQQQADGSWEYEGHAVGITALCTLALLENGLPVTDPVVDKGYRYVRKNIAKLTQTYDIALSLVLLTKLGDRENYTMVRDLAAKLIAGQLTSGGWTYSCPDVTSLVLRNPRLRPQPKDSPGDNSCTQFAVLGLWAASRAGINVDDTMTLVAERFVATQNEDGGWSYRLPSEDMVEPSRNSMTFAGLFCLTVARATRLRQLQGEDDASETSRPAPRAEKGQETQALVDDPVFSKGLTLAGNYTKGIGTGSARYFLWSVERMGVLLGLERFGETDWFQKGAAALLKAQQPDGSWTDPKGGLADTAFAILFLRKANLGSDISRMLEGEPQQAFQNVSQPEKPRFDTLEAALAQAKAGDTIRVDGNGPYKLPHIVISKDVTIEGGFGYLPVFQYDIGFTGGVRSSPARDPEARYMLKAAGGTLTIEGLRLEMDAPEVGQEVPWVALRVEGGNLRVLNCSISEGNRKGMAAIVVAKPAEVAVRNSVIVGGRAGIEILANGKQQLDVENSVLFSTQGISVVPDPAVKQPATIALKLRHTTVQAQNVFHVLAPASTIDITSTSCIYKAAWIGSSFLPAVNDKKGRSWQGSNNLYDVTNWLGGDGSTQPGITDARSFSRFWGETDKDSSNRQVPFQTNRQHGAFSHTVKARDFEISDRATFSTQGSGINALTVGPGSGYSRYRDSILYNEWKKGNLDATVTLKSGD